jgi:hypothetical protein
MLSRLKTKNVAYFSFECCMNFKQVYLSRFIIQEIVMASTVIKRNLWNSRWNNKSKTKEIGSLMVSLCIYQIPLISYVQQ